MISAYPKAHDMQDEVLEQHFYVIQDVIVCIRRLRAMLELGLASIESIYIKLNNSIDNILLEQFVCKLAKVQSVCITQTKPKASVGDVGEFCECYIQLEGIDLSAIISRLQSQKQKCEKAVLEQNRVNLQNTQEKYDKICTELNALTNL